MDEQLSIVIDIFSVPENSKEAFLEKTGIAQGIIKQLPGFVEGYVYVKRGEGDTYNVITTAVWESPEAMASAKTAIANKYAESGFNPQAVMQELGVKMERAIYDRKPY